MTRTQFRMALFGVLSVAFQFSFAVASEPSIHLDFVLRPGILPLSHNGDACDTLKIISGPGGVQPTNSSSVRICAFSQEHRFVDIEYQDCDDLSFQGKKVNSQASEVYFYRYQFTRHEGKNLESALDHVGCDISKQWGIGDFTKG